MNKLLSLILIELRKHHERVYHEDAPSNAKYPYLVYSVSDGFKTHRDDLTLIVDIWDRNDSAMNVEDLTDKIDIGLDSKSIHNDYVVATLFREGRLSIGDPDKTLKRRQLRFSVQTYFR